jgi:UDP-N-acetylglucosamine:LPS N-acetylglucosamine transferase
MPFTAVCKSVSNFERDLQGAAFFAREVIIPRNNTGKPRGSKLLREDLARKLNDIERVEDIMSAYKKMVRTSHLTPQDEWLLEDWLLQKAYFLGSTFYNHHLLFKDHAHFEKNKRFKKEFERFVEAISQERSRPQELFSTPKKNISILYTGGQGGGHKSPAAALAQFCRTQGHNVQLIDIDELENLYSPVVEGYTKAQVYAEVFQKQGDREKAHKLWQKIEAKQTPESRKYMGDARKYVQIFDTHHIFSVAHHRPGLSAISYALGIPMTYVHTDHIFNKSLVPLLKEQAKLPLPLVSFGALSETNTFFGHVFETLKIKNNRLPEKIADQIVKLDFPVRQSFRPASKTEIEELRHELHIPRNAIVAKIAMGQNGAGDEIIAILKHIYQDAKTLKKPLCLFVICGKNEELRKKILALVERKFSDISSIHVNVCGFMEEKEMAKVDRVSDVWITKPGGSTCAELIKTQKQMLYVLNEHHHWEATNAQYLEKLHLAAELNFEKSIIKQMNARIDESKNVNIKKLEKTDWQVHVKNILNGKRDSISSKFYPK